MYSVQCLRILRTKRLWLLAKDCSGCCRTPRHDTFKQKTNILAFTTDFILAFVPAAAADLIELFWLFWEEFSNSSIS